MKFALKPVLALIVFVMKSTVILLVVENTSLTGPGPVYTAAPKGKETVRCLDLRDTWRVYKQHGPPKACTYSCTSGAESYLLYILEAEKQFQNKTIYIYKLQYNLYILLEFFFLLFVWTIRYKIINCYFPCSYKQCFH